jgi:hypothetical protein
MTFRQPAYSTDSYDPEPHPRPDWVLEIPERITVAEASAKAVRAFFRGVFVGAIGLAAILAAGAAWSQDLQCDSADRVTGLLADKYGETLRATGLGGGDSVMSLWASDATGSWTITVTLPDGQMCLVASGMEFAATPRGEPV